MLKYDKILVGVERICMIKNSLKTLQERYGNIERENSNNLAKFMKRTRIDQKRTLEDVSRGVCSPSYLSKIENCQVDVDEYYFQSLFEKLDLKYENLKVEREPSFFSKIIKYYLLERYDLLEENLKRMVNVNSYCDTELELIILLNNIIKENYDEAEILITKLEEVRKTLTKEELYLLSFLITLYLYSTNQYCLAVKQIEILIQHPSENEYYNMAVCDLGMDIYFILGKESLFYQLYQKLKQFNKHELYNNRILIHNMQNLVFQARNGKFNLLEELETIKMALSKTNVNEERIIMNEALIYYYLEDYRKVLEITESCKTNVQIMVVEASAINRLNDISKSIKFADKIKTIDFNLKSTVYSDFLEYMREKFEQYSYVKLLSYLKNVILPKSKENYVFWIYEQENLEYFTLCFELGKYKEVVRFLIKTEDFKKIKKI